VPRRFSAAEAFRERRTNGAGIHHWQDVAASGDLRRLPPRQKIYRHKSITPKLKSEVDTMSVEVIHDQGQTLSIPVGKVVGVVDTKDELGDVVSALAEAGFDVVQYLHGDEGIHLLQRADRFFWGDCEEEVLQAHTRELKQGHFVIAIATPSDRVEEAADVAALHGARHLVHFGFWTVTQLT
jgi:hypothetical protein